jgi:phytoene dehydrogenase-like protein
MRDECFDVVVIGAGIGGLIAANYCAKFGYTTLLLDKQKIPGGNCTSFKEQGLLFDTSVYSVTGVDHGGVLHEVFTDLGIDHEGHFIEMSPAERIIFPGFDIDVCRDKEAFRDALCARFPHEAQGIADYVALMAELYRDVRMLGAPGGARPDMANIIKYGARSQLSVLDEHIGDPHVKAVLSVGVPHDYSFLHAAAWKMDNHCFGNFYPKGGAIHLAKLLVDHFRRANGIFLNEQEVSRIVVEGGLATAVVTAQGRTFRCAHVISNSDARSTLTGLVGAEHLPLPYVNKLNGLKISNSAFCVFVGLDASPADWGFSAASVYYHPSWDTVRIDHDIERGELPDDIWLLVNFPSLKDPALVRDGKHSMVIMIYVPFDYGGQTDWNYTQRDAYLAIKKGIEERVLAIAEGLMPGLREHIVFTNTSSPMSFVRYTGNPQGATSGFSGRPRERMNVPQNQTPIRNLALAGQWTFPGSSVPSCAKSGKIAAGLAKRFLGGAAAPRVHS